MNKIRTRINKDTNFVFHMLSVAGCGYDNSYGEKFRKIHKEADLRILKQYEKRITIVGGEFIGELYELLIIKPACAEKTAYDYYTGIYDIFHGFQSSIQADNDIINLTLQYGMYQHEICEISKVMFENYDIYINDVWKEQEKIITDYARIIETKFEESQFSVKAEELLKQSFQKEFFYISMCNSIKDGAEAINISDDQDVFGIERSYEDSLYFIGHEFIIFLLLQELKGTCAFQTFETWELTEGLAEFYLTLIMGSSGFFNEQMQYIDFYRKVHTENPDSSALQLFLAAEKYYIKKETI